MCFFNRDIILILEFEICKVLKTILSSWGFYCLDPRHSPSPHWYSRFILRSHSRQRKITPYINKMLQREINTLANLREEKVSPGDSQELRIFVSTFEI